MGDVKNICVEVVRLRQKILDYFGAQKLVKGNLYFILLFLIKLVINHDFVDVCNR